MKNEKMGAYQSDKLPKYCKKHLALKLLKAVYLSKSVDNLNKQIYNMFVIKTN